VCTFALDRLETGLGRVKNVQDLLHQRVILEAAVSGVGPAVVPLGTGREGVGLAAQEIRGIIVMLAVAVWGSGMAGVGLVVVL
jgi:hypothetical protein